MECGLGPSTSYYYYYHWKVLVGNRPHGKVNYLGWAEYVALGAAGWLAGCGSRCPQLCSRGRPHTEDHVNWAAIILVGRTF